MFYNSFGKVRQQLYKPVKIYFNQINLIKFTQTKIKITLKLKLKLKFKLKLKLKLKFNQI